MSGYIWNNNMSRKKVERDYLEQFIALYWPRGYKDFGQLKLQWRAKITFGFIEKNLDDPLVLVLVVVVVAAAVVVVAAVVVAAAGMTIIWCPFEAQCVDVGLNQICFWNFPFYNELAYSTAFNFISFLMHLSIHFVVINTVKWLILEINYLFWEESCH